MTNDIKQAAERYTSHIAGLNAMIHPRELPYSYIDETTGAGGMCQEAWDRDAHRLAKAYLAQLASDDEEPVTEEWLRSVGAKDVYEYRHDGQDVYGLYIGPAKWFNFTNGSELLIDHRDGYVIKTRRQVRQLLQALGITTNGEKASNQ
jgi:hypothetical protein